MGYSSGGSASGGSKFYNQSGEITAQVKEFVFTGTTDGSGNASIDMSAAGFSAIPIITAIAVNASGTAAQDRAWINITSNTTASQVNLTSVRGRIIIAIVLGGGATCEAAPNTLFMLRAVGI